MPLRDGTPTDLEKFSNFLCFKIFCNESVCDVLTTTTPPNLVFAEAEVTKE